MPLHSQDEMIWGLKLDCFDDPIISRDCGYVKPVADAPQRLVMTGIYALGDGLAGLGRERSQQ